MTAKGISRQVIVVQSPNPKLFDQAIFILSDSAIGNDGVTEEQLLKEANNLIIQPRRCNKGRYRLQEFLLLGIGASITGLIWFLTVFF